MSPTASEIRGVVAAVTRTIPLEKLELPEEFFPAHLSVALIDAVFRSPSRDWGHVEEIIDRYCRRFGIPRTRERKWKTPAAHKQESIRDLIGHFEELGVDRMKKEVFQVRRCLPGTRISKVEYILHAAKALRFIGVDVLQDLPSLPSEDIEEALQSSSDANDHIARKFVMCTGDDDYVRGDVHVRRFVAEAIGQASVSATRARSLVRRSAYELILSPRFLYLQIRRYCLSRQERERVHFFGEPSPLVDESGSARGYAGRFGY